MREVMRNELWTQRDSGNVVHHFQQTQLMPGLKQNDSLLQQSDLGGRHLVEYADDRRRLEEDRRIRDLIRDGPQTLSERATIAPTA